MPACLPACLPPPQWDLLAGISVGFMIIPQGMSYANIAGGGHSSGKQQQQQAASAAAVLALPRRTKAKQQLCYGCSKPPSAASC
jgi:hypothetical protein